jgi:hypothetical protein
MRTRIPGLGALHREARRTDHTQGPRAGSFDSGKVRASSAPEGYLITKTQPGALFEGVSSHH